MIIAVMSQSQPSQLQSTSISNIFPFKQKKKQTVLGSLHFISILPLYSEYIYKMSLVASDIPLPVQREQPNNPNVHGTSLPTHTSRSVQLLSLSAHHSITGHFEASAWRLHVTELGGGAGCWWPFNPPHTELINDRKGYRGSAPQ